MTPSDGKSPTRGAVAGMIMLAALVLCAGLGALIGALVGALALFLIAGVFAGFALGLYALRVRYSDI